MLKSIYLNNLLILLITLVAGKALSQSILNDAVKDGEVEAPGEYHLKGTELKVRTFEDFEHFKSEVLKVQKDYDGMIKDRMKEIKASSTPPGIPTPPVNEFYIFFNSELSGQSFKFQSREKQQFIIKKYDLLYQTDMIKDSVKQTMRKIFSQCGRQYDVLVSYPKNTNEYRYLVKWTCDNKCTGYGIQVKKRHTGIVDTVDTTKSSELPAQFCSLLWNKGFNPNSGVDIIDVTGEKFAF